MLEIKPAYHDAEEIAINIREVQGLGLRFHEVWIVEGKAEVGGVVEEEGFVECEGLLVGFFSGYD